MSGFLLALIAGLVTGALTGAGVGGGTLLMLYLTGVAGVPQAAAQGVNLLYYLVSAPPAILQHLKQKRIDLAAALPAAGVGMLCALLAALLAGRLDPGLLRRLFGALLCAVGLRELFFGKKS